VERWIRAVADSMMPAEALLILTEALPFEPPYWRDASMPQYLLAGELVVIGLYKPR